MTYAIAIVNKNLVNRTVSFENELVPLNGRIVPLWLMRLSNSMQSAAKFAINMAKHAKLSFKM